MSENVIHHAEWQSAHKPLVSSVRVEQTPSHDIVHVWNRGGKAGTLVVDKGDGELIAGRLLPHGSRESLPAPPSQHGAVQAVREDA